jgi:hypothetical protein
MRQIDDEFAIYGNEIGDCAAAKTAAGREREEALAIAYCEAIGNSTDRRQAALKSVGSMGKDEDVAYAKIMADFELRHARSTHLMSLLKRASDEDPRYRS